MKQQRSVDNRVEVVSSDDDENSAQQQQQPQQQQQQQQQQNSAPPAATTPKNEEPITKTEEDDMTKWGPVEYKNAGNKCYMKQDYEGALNFYRLGLERAEIRPRPVHRPAAVLPQSSSRRGDDNDDDDDEQQNKKQDDEDSDKKESESNAKDSDEEAKKAKEQDQPPTPEQLAAWTLTAQLHCNAAFMLIEMKRFEEALPDLDEALRHDPTYLKAYQRRAQCNWEPEKHSACYADIEKAEKEYGWRLDANWRQRKEFSKKKMDEEVQKMWGQLKDLGNMVLGKFGLSTDNFKFDKDPNTGGYSMRFEK